MDQEHAVLYNQYPNLSKVPHVGGKIIAEYVWLDGSGLTLRSKCRTLDKKVESLADLPEWNYDGSSCYQASAEQSEITMKPVAYFPDPFRGGDNILVMTETFKWEDATCKKLVPANTNFRHFAQQIFEDEEATAEMPWFGIEQEFTLLGTSNKFTKWPLGWPSNGYPGPQGPYYCGVGANVSFGRIISDQHYRACLAAGINISGTNAEVMPGQWEYQVGPCLGLEMGDHLMMSRYILARIAEDYNTSISFAPKLFPDWNGSGCHTNFSTETMRQGTKGMDYINDMMKKFGDKHDLHVTFYGDDNQKRMTGQHETSDIKEFSFGVGNRGASFRIPTATAHANGKGYIEDRRPASNIDPYIVSAMQVDTGILAVSKAGPMIKHFEAWKTWRETADIEKID